MKEERVAIAYDKTHGPFIDEVRRALDILKIKFRETLDPTGPDEQDGSDCVFHIEARSTEVDKLMSFISANKDASESALKDFWVGCR